MFFALQNNAVDELDFPGLQVEEELFSTGTSRFDLLVNLTELPPDRRGGYEGLVEYATDLFDRSTIEQFVARFGQLLRLVTTDPTIPVSKMDVLLDDEHPQPAPAENDTAAALLPTASIPQMFSQQARTSPEAIALRHADQLWTYRDLDRRSNQLARRLLSHGAGRDTVIAIALPRSPQLVIAALAVLKAGAAYLPLNPANPGTHLARVLGSAAADIVIVNFPTEEHSELGRDGRTVIAMSDLPDDDHDDDPLDLSRTPDWGDDLCYVITTSGSTGTPKPTMVPHRGVTNTVHWYRSTLNLHPHSRVLVVASPTFDLTQKNFWAPLSAGGQVIGARAVRPH